jgi:hypothetical protein
MEEGGRVKEPRPPRWDSIPLGYVTPRWDDGVRYWPGAVLLGSVFVLFLALPIPFGFTGGPLVTAALVASYPILLVLAPIRNRLVPREVGASPSSMPMRVWVFGWLLVAAATACYPLALTVPFGNYLLSFFPFSLWYGILFSGIFCVQKAPAWEQWRNRPRKRRRNSPRNGDGPQTGAATLGQPQ